LSHLDDGNRQVHDESPYELVIDHTAEGEPYIKVASVTSQSGKTRLAGSLAGAAHLLNNNAGALKRLSVRTEIPCWSSRAKGTLMMQSSVLIQNMKVWPSDPLP
jgi:hypothetical protein